MKHSGGVRVKTTGSAVLVLSKARAGLFGILEVIRGIIEDSVQAGLQYDSVIQNTVSGKTECEDNLFLKLKYKKYLCKKICHINKML